MPMRRQYVFVDLSNHPDIVHFNDKGLNLDPDDPRAPFIAAFLMHEARARGYRPYRNPKISDCLLDSDGGDGGEGYPGNSNEHSEGGTGNDHDHNHTHGETDLQQSLPTQPAYTYRMVLTSLKPVNFHDPETIKFLSRDSMIDLGFRNWVACEAENRGDSSVRNEF